MQFVWDVLCLPTAEAADRWYGGKDTASAAALRGIGI